MNYYNEFDPKAAAWLRELISEGLIPYGTVDERSITEVSPTDLAKYTQCHFFAGIGGWPYALRLAGWPDDQPVWTGSCPCQPFSCAGKGLGEADERHLWPVFRELIRACKPPTVFGEQVASKAGREWLAGVFADLEGMAYQRAGADLCAAGIGAPHIRQRLFWVAYASHERHRDQRNAKAGRGESKRDRGLGDTDCKRGQAPRIVGAPRETISADAGQTVGAGNSIPNTSWADAIWHQCRDGKARRIPSPEPGVLGVADGLQEGLDASWLESGFPLAPKIQGRVQLLKGYGNAIVPQLAAEFILASLDAIADDGGS